MTLRDRWFLWWNDVCTKHLIKKQVSWGGSWCTKCWLEKRKTGPTKYQLKREKIDAVIAKYAPKQ